MVLAGFTPNFHKRSDWGWVTAHFSYFWSLSRTHLYLALVSVLIGLVLALPVGVLAVRVPRTYGPILTVTTIVYSLPSIAVFAFLVSITGLSNNTVLLPLAGYAVALLVRSVIDGLASVPEETRIAATAMGYRSFRRLISVELPTAVPVIVAGLRIAVVSNISLVTVGALIGIGGLGDLFELGEAANFQTEVFTGVVLVVFWAFLLDALILRGGRLLSPWARRRRS
jgi:osmoprotectant transport system permease protein